MWHYRMFVLSFSILCLFKFGHFLAFELWGHTHLVFGGVVHRAVLCCCWTALWTMSESIRSKIQELENEVMQHKKHKGGWNWLVWLSTLPSICLMWVCLCAPRPTCKKSLLKYDMRTPLSVLLELCTIGVEWRWCEFSFIYRCWNFTPQHKSQYSTTTQ